MDAKTFSELLKKHEQEARDKIVALVQLAQEQEGLEWNTDKPLSFASDPNWNYAADSLAELTGWVYDRVNGRNRTAKKSVTKKIRKALGYSCP